MTGTRRDVLRAAAALGLVTAAGHSSASAQSYPNRPIRLLVGGAAGSVPDMLARLLGDRLATSIGQPVVVDNRPGAGGIIGMEALLASPPDGHTLALVTMSQAVFNSYLFAKLPYDPLRDLVPVATLVSGGLTLVVQPNVPARDFGDLVAWSRGASSQMFLGTAALGSPPHIASLLLMRASGLAATVVPFKSGPEGVSNILRGDLHAFVDAPPIVLEHVRSGALRALVVTSYVREAQLPDVPTIAEAGFPTAGSEPWIGVVAPARTPGPIVSELNRELAAILMAPDIIKRLEALSFTPLVRTPEAFATLVREDHRRWGPIIRDARLRLE